MPSITSLCQNGQLREAYTQANECLSQHPASSFAQNDMQLVMRAYLKKAAADNDMVAATRCLDKLAALQLPPNAAHTEKLCWEIRPLLQSLSKQQPLPGPAAGRLLEALTRVELAPEPSRGRSVLLQVALKFRDFLPAGWWSWWNLALFMPEDYQGSSFTPAGGSKVVQQPALVETAYGAYVKQLIGQLKAPQGNAGITMVDTARAEAQGLLPRLEELATRYPAGWMSFHRAKLLVALGGDLAGALAALLPVVRRKSTEFWVWSLLGETLQPTDPETALACYYKASTCRSEEIYLGKVRERVATMMHTQGHLAEAQYQLQLLVKGKEATNLKPSYAVSQLLAQAWYKEDYTAQRRQNATLRQNWLEAADAAAYGDQPWQPVVLQFISEETPEKPARVQLLPVASEGATRSLSVLLKKYRWLSKLQPGTPLQVRSESVDGRLKVIQAKPRPEGQPWDVVAAQTAIVTSLTADKARVFFSVEPGLSGAFRAADFQLPELRAGDTIQVRLQTRTKQERAQHFVLAVEPTTNLPDERVCRSFAGPLRLHPKGFGFADNIFLPPQLISQHGWLEGTMLTGRAVLSYNKLKKKDEWSAVQVSCEDYIPL